MRLLFPPENKLQLLLLLGKDVTIDTARRHQTFKDDINIH